MITLESRSLDADELLDAVQRRPGDAIAIVGDAFAKPILARARRGRRARDARTTCPRCRLIISSGVMWTAEVKEALLDRMEQLVLVDAIGSTEGSMGISITMKGLPPSTAKFNQMPDDEGVHRRRPRGASPAPARSAWWPPAATCRSATTRTPRSRPARSGSSTACATRSPATWPRSNADGSLILLGRGSQVHQHRRREGLPRGGRGGGQAGRRASTTAWSSACPTSASARPSPRSSPSTPGATTDEAAIIAEVKQHLAGYKAPKRVVFVAQVPRAPNGKADYRTAREQALASG